MISSRFKEINRRNIYKVCNEWILTACKDLNEKEQI